MLPIKRKYEFADNRANRRKVFKERDYLLGAVWEFEHNFTLDLFHPELSLSYAEIYNAYIDGWKKLVRSLEQRKIRYFDIDKDYFKKLYKPIEK